MNEQISIKCSVFHGFTGFMAPDVIFAVKYLLHIFGVIRFLFIFYLA